MIYPLAKNVGIFLATTLMGIGFVRLGITTPEVMFALLELRDLPILIALAITLLVLIIFLRLLPGLTKETLLSDEFEVSIILPDLNVLIGGIFFGLGLGLMGMAPMTAVVAVGGGLVAAPFAVFGMLLGIVVAAHFYFVRR